MYVIGTAGHVDHGKSTLVKALTGIDPDRLQEEKEREMTIDLGFAWLTLPSGREVSIVDVPGHERFVKNMLAGAGGFDLAMLVVAADESVMPQTREHLAILGLLQVKSGLAVISKKELVDEEWLALVKEEVRETLAQTSLAGAPIVAVSAVTGEGLDELKSILDNLLQSTPTRRDLGRPRLPIDRSFAAPGFGTVVTGTLVDGTLSLGQEVELVLTGQSSRIRGLQSHRKRADTAIPGRRTAVNLTGVEHTAVQRGEVLTIPGWLRPTRSVDVRLVVLSDAGRTIRHGSGVTFHTGTIESEARVRLLEKSFLEPGEEGWAQLFLERPVAVVKGDFFVIRASDTTVGGGSIIEPYARRHRRSHPETLARLSAMSQGSPRELLLNALETAVSFRFEAVVRHTNLSEEEARRQLVALADEGLVKVIGASLSPNSLVYSRSGWHRLKQHARDFLGSYHLQYPLRRGASKEELRSRLNMAAEEFGPALHLMAQEGVLVENMAQVSLPEHRVVLKPQEEARVKEYLSLLGKTPYSPPTDLALDPDLLNLLVEEGKVVRVSENVVFSPSAYKEMAQGIVMFIREHGSITIAQVRDMFSTSRKYALALLEQLDQQRVTRRVGDERVLRQP